MLAPKKNEYDTNIDDFLKISRLSNNINGTIENPTLGILELSHKGIAGFFKCLNDSQIPYLIVGSMADAYYGCIRPAENITIWISSEDDAANNLKTNHNILSDCFDDIKNQVVTYENESFHLATYVNLSYFSPEQFNYCYTRCHPRCCSHK